MKEATWTKISRFEGPEQSPGFLLWQASTKWRRAVEQALAPLDLTHPQFVLLANLGWLTREDVHVSQIELARHCSVDVNMTSQILRSLEKKGYIERHRCEGDERSRFPKLTGKGAKLVEKAIPLVEKADTDFFNVLGTKKKNECIGILAKLA
jgi:DNA-binding MarR family transcriptional regulator